MKEQQRFKSIVSHEQYTEEEREEINKLLNDKSTKFVEFAHESVNIIHSVQKLCKDNKVDKRNGYSTIQSILKSIELSRKNIDQINEDEKDIYGKSNNTLSNS